MNPYELTIILPCAGQGSRLGLDSPKELLEILPGIRLIDFSLAHILAAAQLPSLKITTTIVSRPWKTDVPIYVKNHLSPILKKTHLYTIMFNNHYHEWPGSVYSAQDTFSKYNLVLLPDTFLSLSEPCNHLDTTNSLGQTLAELMISALDSFPVAFGFIPCTNPHTLKKLGAMTVDKNRVTFFQDKPTDNLHRYNSFWGCYGFRADYSSALYQFLVRSVRQQFPSITQQPFYPAGAFPLGNYQDLGTWESIEAFRIRWQESS